MKENIVNYIYLFALLYNFAISMYWTCYETIIFNINEKCNYKKFFVICRVAENLVYILAPLGLGLIIKETSFSTSFLIVLLITFIVFTMSLFLNKVEIEVNKINLKKYFNSLKNKKIYKKILFQNILDGFTTDGASEKLATVIIYSKLLDTFISGTISGVSNFIGILVAIFYMKFVNKKNFSKIVIPITFIILLLTIFVSFYSSIFFIILYIILNEIGVDTTDITGTSLTYECLNNITESKNNNDYLWTIQFFYDIGRIIAYGIVFIICRFIPEFTSVAFIIFGISFVLRSFIINNILKNKIVL